MRKRRWSPHFKLPGQAAPSSGCAWWVLPKPSVNSFLRGRCLQTMRYAKGARRCSTLRPSLLHVWASQASQDLPCGACFLSLSRAPTGMLAYDVYTEFPSFTAFLLTIDSRPDICTHLKSRFGQKASPKLASDHNFSKKRCNPVVPVEKTGEGSNQVKRKFSR